MINFLKALSSSSSSSSSSNNELSIQLQPHKLEQQQYLNLVQTSKSNDRRALDLITKFPANFPIKSSFIQAPKNLIDQHNYQK
jgi:hypothetical protein